MFKFNKFATRFTALLASFLLVAFVAVPSSAAERDGVRMPDRIKVGDKALALNGLGTREATFMNVDVYVAGLYLEKRSSDPREIIGSEQYKRLALHFVRDVERKDITGAWKEGFEKNATPAQLAQLRARIDRLNSWMTAMKKGEQLTFTYVPGQGVTVSVKGTPKGTLHGSDFARVFLSIWLGPEPPNAGLKQGLLGKK